MWSSVRRGGVRALLSAGLLREMEQCLICLLGVVLLAWAAVMVILLGRSLGAGMEGGAAALCGVGSGYLGGGAINQSRLGVTLGSACGGWWDQWHGLEV